MDCRRAVLHISAIDWSDYYRADCRGHRDLYRWCAILSLLPRHADRLANDMSLLFDDENLHESYMEQVTGALASQGQQFAVYEGGPSTWWGDASNSERNWTIAGAGSAASDAELALNLWTSGTPIVNLWNLAQTDFVCNGSSCPNFPIGNTCGGTPPSPMSADMWGIVDDLPTGLLRPRGLALQLLITISLLRGLAASIQPARTYTGVTVGAWHDSHNLWNVAIVNSNANAQNIVVQFPSTTGLPAGTVSKSTTHLRLRT